jgi:hypothetical protein
MTKKVSDMFKCFCYCVNYHIYAAETTFDVMFENVTKEMFSTEKYVHVFYDENMDAFSLAINSASDQAPDEVSLRHNKLISTTDLNDFLPNLNVSDRDGDKLTFAKKRLSGLWRKAFEDDLVYFLYQVLDKKEKKIIQESIDDYDFLENESVDYLDDWTEIAEGQNWQVPTKPKQINIYEPYETPYYVDDNSYYDPDGFR